MQSYLSELFPKPKPKPPRHPVRVTTNDDWRGLEIWLVYEALLHESNGAQKCGYPIPYGKMNDMSHPRCGWVDYVCRRYAARKGA